MKTKIFQFTAVASALVLAYFFARYILFEPSVGISQATRLIVTGAIVLCVIAAVCALAKKVLPIYLISIALVLFLGSLGPAIWVDLVLLLSAVGLHLEQGLTRAQAIKYGMAVLALVVLIGTALYLLQGPESGTIKIDDLPFGQR